ncbi:MAG: hypothetical protein U0271_25245 [Polyangiaceae bacterium]
MRLRHAIAASLTMVVPVALGCSSKQHSDDSAEVSLSAASSASTQPTGSSPARDDGPLRGSECRVDADCAWDDPCMPSACSAGPKKPQNCDESAPEPGVCGCRAGHCAIVYKPAPVSCATDRDCGWQPECTPRTCGAAIDTSGSCDKSFPPPGECRCLDRMCAGVVHRR